MTTTKAFGQREAKDRKGQITVEGARRERRCECTRGIVCMGAAEGEYACGRSATAWDVRFCLACQRECRQPEVPR
jgi:hypothetical protein